MSDLTREEVIRILENEIGIDIISADAHRAIEYAIASIKTDEAYDLMYEGLDVIPVPEGATVKDVAKLVFPDATIGEYAFDSAIYIDNKRWNSPYRKERE